MAEKADKTSPVVFFGNGTFFEHQNPLHGVRFIDRKPPAIREQNLDFARALSGAGIEVVPVLAWPPFWQYGRKNSRLLASSGAVLPKLDISGQPIFPKSGGEKEASRYAEEATSRVVGVIDLNPLATCRAVLERIANGDYQVYNPIIIGGVGLDGLPDVTEFESQDSSLEGKAVLDISVDEEVIQMSSHENGSFTLDVTPVPEMSIQAALKFAELLHGYNF